jgi:DNA-binding transcriptional MerR regulator
MKRAGGRRFYRPQDLQVLRGVRRLLYDEGYTIMGVQKLQREQGLSRLIASGGGAAARVTAEPAGPEAEGQGLASGPRRDLAAALQGLEEAKARLDRVLGGG